MFTFMKFVRCKTSQSIVYNMTYSSYRYLRYISNKHIILSSMATFTENRTSQVETNLDPPAAVQGMKQLDRNKFKKDILVPFIEVEEKELRKVVQIIKKYLFKIKSFKPIQNRDDSSLIKNIILNPKMVHDRCEELGHLLEQCKIKDNVRFFNITLTYDNWTAHEVLKAILPTGNESLTSFSIIGHIVHVNLREHLLPFKEIIGQVLLDKVKGSRTVVNKLESIDNAFRFFKMEVLCGEDDMLANVRANGCQYEFDFSKVYWNPRLSTEHERIVKMIPQGSILYDVFAGVGPFAILAAKNKCHVMANDLNPESYKWLIHNSKLNKVQQILKAFNKDGRAFIMEDVKHDLLQRCRSNDDKDLQIHITMNLPGLAVNFLDAFRGLYTREEIYPFCIGQCPIVHVYCFVPGEDIKRNATELIIRNIGVDITPHVIDIFYVRHVSPNKEMMRVTFKLTEDVLCASPRTNELDSCSMEPPPKLPRLDNYATDTNNGQAEEEEQQQQQQQHQECIQSCWSSELEDKK